MEILWTHCLARFQMSHDGKQEKPSLQGIGACSLADINHSKSLTIPH